jgi:predicted benzoate:H+ symporter BenE
MPRSVKLINTLLWGFILWLAGYLAGIVLFFVVPKNYIGWVLTPFATLFTIWVLTKKIHRSSLVEYLLLALIWTTMAIALDYFFLVKLFNSPNYYKPDVYFYYLLTLSLPLLVGHLKLLRHQPYST